MKQQILLSIALLSAILTAVNLATAQATAFTYQGRLNDGGNPAQGSYDFRFRLTSDSLANNYVGAPVVTNAVPVTNGLFIITMDFGTGVFTGSNYWLELDVKTNGGAAYAVLTPIQSLRPVPYAIFANAASNVSGTVSASQLSGTVANSLLPSSANFSGTIAANSFSGNGAGITNVNAASLNGLNAASFWQLGGNNISGGQFIGATNNQPVEVWAGGQRAIRLEPATDSAPNVIEGSAGNFVGSGVEGATIGGGGAINYSGTGQTLTNSVLGNLGTVGGGGSNVVFGYSATVSGGLMNTAQGNTATVGGGYQNLANGLDAIVSGGVQNTAIDFASTVGGGVDNAATNLAATVPGGEENLAGGQYSLAAGRYARAIHQGAFVWADSQAAYFPSTNNDSFNVRSQGGVRFLTGSSGVTLDGPVNLPTNVTFTACGYPCLRMDNVNYYGNTFLGVAAGSGSAYGLGNTAVGDTAMGYNNSGMYNSALGSYSLYHNSSGNNNVAIGSMALNSANGSANIAVGYQSGINLNGTEGNDIYIGNSGVSGESSTIRIGTQGVQSSSYLAGVINGNGGGLTNLNASQLSGGTISDTRLSANVPFLNANQTFSGQNAFNNSGNSFSGNGANLTSLNANNLSSGTVPLARLPVAVVTNNDSNVTLNGVFTLANSGTSFSITPGYLFAAASNNCVTLDVPGFGQKIAIWDNLYVSDNIYASGAVYANGVQLTSDRNAKENFMPLNSGEVLQKVTSLPISEWDYKNDASNKHIGPMAQDFHQAFGLNGEDDKHISVVDEGGVALAAIQGLNEKVEERNEKQTARIQNSEDKIQKLEAENETLKQQNDALAERLTQLEVTFKSLSQKK